MKTLGMERRSLARCDCGEKRALRSGLSSPPRGPRLHPIMQPRHSLMLIAFGTGFLLLALICVLLFFTATVETGSVGVVTNFGRITGETLDSGWHLVGPVDHVTEVSIPHHHHPE